MVQRFLSGMSRGAVLLAVLCLGCTEGGTGPSLNRGADPDDVVFVALASLPSTYMEALYKGHVLVDDEGCPRLEGWSGNPTVVWPHRYSLASIDGRLFVRDEEGKVVARLDGEFTMGGGETGTVDHVDLSPESRAALAESCPGTFFLASPFG